MELRLARKTQARAAVEERERSSRQQLHAMQARLDGGLELPLQGLHRVSRCEEQEAVEAREIAVDLLGGDDRLYLIDRRPMACGRQARAFLSMHTLDLEVPVIQRTAQMSGGAARLPAADLSILDDENGSARLCQQVSRGQARDASPDNANIRTAVGLEGHKGRHWLTHPDRRGGARFARHSGPPVLDVSLPIPEQLPYREAAMRPYAVRRRK